MASSDHDTSFTFLRRLFRSIAQLCLRRGLKVQSVFEALKLAFIDAAQDQLEKGGNEITISKLAVMTGLQRKDIKRLLDTESLTFKSNNLMVNVMGTWLQSKKYRTGRGKPRPLTFLGADSEFARLVESTSLDLNPYTVLFELERIGAVKKVGNTLTLVMDTYVPTKDVVNNLHFLADDVNNLLHAVEENVFSEPDVPNHHVTTQYDNISEEAVPRIKQWLLEQGAAFHKRAREFISKYDKDVNPDVRKKSHESVKVTLGSFSRIEHGETKKHGE